MCLLRLGQNARPVREGRGVGAEGESGTEKLTGDAGFLLLREALDRTALIEPLAAQLEDPRDPRRVTHSLLALVRGSVAMIAQRWADQSNAVRLHVDSMLGSAADDTGADIGRRDGRRSHCPDRGGARVGANSGARLSCGLLRLQPR